MGRSIPERNGNIRGSNDELPIVRQDNRGRNTPAVDWPLGQQGPGGRIETVDVAVKRYSKKLVVVT